MGSNRLPGKVLKEIMNRPMLQYQIERMKRSETLDDIVIATTTKEIDKAIVEFCQKLKINYYCGSEDDVLARYYEAASKFHASVIVRITSDCPIIDHRVIDKVVKYYLMEKEKYDYVSNTLERTFPRGMDTEIFSYKALKEAHSEACMKFQREHVTPFIFQNPKRYRLANITYPENLSHHRWTVDKMEDLLLIKNIIEHIYPEKHDFSLEDTLEILNMFPEWSLLNNHIEQKKI